MAAQRADDLLERGDMDGCRVWKRILKAIEELERTEREAMFDRLLPDFALSKLADA